jgi:hypothetical protein
MVLVSVAVTPQLKDKEKEKFAAIQDIPPETNQMKQQAKRLEMQRVVALDDNGKTSSTISIVSLLSSEKFS